MSPPGSRHFLTKTWSHPTACKLKSLDASGQTSNRAGTQPHPSADKLLKAVLSPQPPLKAPLDMGLSTIETRPSLTHQGADTRSKRNYNSAACGTTNTESQTN